MNFRICGIVFASFSSGILGGWGARYYCTQPAPSPPESPVPSGPVSVEKIRQISATPELFMYAAAAGRLELVRRILDGFSLEEKQRALNSRTYHLGTPLAEAIRKGDLPMIKLLAQHSSVEQLSSGNQGSLLDQEPQESILMLARKKCFKLSPESCGMMMQILKHYMNPIPCTSKGLKEAIQQRDVQRVEDFFIRCSSQEINEALSSRDKEHGTPLGMAVQNGDLVIVRHLLSFMDDERASLGEQCASSDPYYVRGEGRIIQDKSHAGINASVIALRKCAEAQEMQTGYPCDAVLSLLSKKESFAILRNESSEEKKE